MQGEKADAGGAKKIKRIGVLASGGDTPGMNAATRAVVKEAEEENIAAQLGAHAVRLLAQGIGNRAIGIKGEKVVDTDIMEAVNTPKLFRSDLYELACTLTK